MRVFRLSKGSQSSITGHWAARARNSFWPTSDIPGLLFQVFETPPKPPNTQITRATPSLTGPIRYFGPRNFYGGNCRHFGTHLKRLELKSMMLVKPDTAMRRLTLDRVS